MNKICTSINQSEKLIELGIDVNTADMYWWSTSKRSYIEAMDDGDFNEAEGHIPAWSLSVLLGMMPFQIIENNILYSFHIGKGYNKNGRTFCIKYKVNDNVVLFETHYLNDPIDAAFEMIYLLKENNKI